MDRLDVALGDLVDKSRDAAKASKKEANAKKAAAAKAKKDKEAALKKKKEANKKSAKAVKVTNRAGKSGKGSPVKVGGGGAIAIMKRLGGGSGGRDGTGSIKVLATNFQHTVTKRDVRELAFLVTQDVNISMFKPGAFDLHFDRMRDAKSVIKRFNGVELDGRPMRFVLDDEKGVSSGRQVSVFGGRGGRDSGKGAPVRVRVTNDRTKSFKANLADAKKKVEKAKAKGGKKERELKKKEKKEPRKEEPPKSAADLDAEMDAYFAAKKDE